VDPLLCTWNSLSPRRATGLLGGGPRSLAADGLLPSGAIVASFMSAAKGCGRAAAGEDQQAPCRWPPRMGYLGAGVNKAAAGALASSWLERQRFMPRRVTVQEVFAASRLHVRVVVLACARLIKQTEAQVQRTGPCDCVPSGHVGILTSEEHHASKHCCLRYLNIHSPINIERPQAQNSRRSWRLLTVLMPGHSHPATAEHQYESEF
jgi:hypothetical protein